MKGWNNGVPFDYLRKLAGYWRTSYNWRKHEARLTGFPQYYFNDRWGEHSYPARPRGIVSSSVYFYWA
ncbi:epoxide hydrolase N-terminal domain-containing protein [Paenibacillus lautus]|uniref:epoxide hydrolase N-terminal domain-containing protein n=1 Tax=Paenibacillus TaxID=44249 RepID=UPI001C7CA86D|nr:epoxide hydrolase N-terminal domain-containing protein [Paenibacillus lautus]MBX4150384.1 epoxide hydrolase N-terminal domain-containing protein [Paenibacillus lautus]